jgi:hypothetical protein
MLRGKVGTAPGTTTLRLDGLGAPWGPQYHDPSQAFMPPGATIVGGAMVPHDLELAKIFGYTPYMEGWVVGKRTTQDPGVSVERESDVSGYSFAGFGQSSVATVPTQEEMDRQLMMKRYEEEMKTMRWNRVVNGISAVAAVGALMISIAAFRRRR